MGLSFSDFARSVNFETAFNVLAVAKRLKAAGKRVIELEIGDSPFASTSSAKRAGIEAIESDKSHYCPSVGLPELRAAASAYVNREHRLRTTADNIIVAPGAKPFEQFFCEAFLNPGDGALVFSPYFPTYVPNIVRRGARPVFAALRQDHEFRPELEAVERFLAEDKSPRAIFLNTPHNPTGGVATEDDLKRLATLVRGRDVAVFSDEPYDQMVWRGKHRSILEYEGMLDQCVAAYTFSKSYSMSGWRLGFAVASPAIVDIFSKLLNTTLSCVPPLVQLAGAAALEHDTDERNATMQKFRRKVELLTTALAKVPGVRCLDPAATFYAFPSVAEICNRLGITSHGLAMYLLEGADEKLGVACLGGECFGDAGAGFIRFSCAEPDDAILEAVAFFADAVQRKDRVDRYLGSHESYRLSGRYA
ncbi:MAG TPA: pyridoxal phosphate-dependent aminotransferase [Pirellulales bacterium]|nr:pyridoxal phosphate-dependent aminotransferase [Pirellulales bacterium]